MSHRVTATLTSDEFERLKYWSKKKGVSINEYLRDALDRSIRFENKDYGPEMNEIIAARLAQQTDAIVSHTTRLDALSDMMASLADSIVRLMRGHPYLMSEEDGEL